MNKKRTNWLIGVLVSLSIILTSFFSGFFIARNIFYDKELEDVKFILDLYRKYYYFEEDKDNLHLIADSILDEYSEYYTKEEYEILQKSRQGYHKALGISFSTNDLTIANVTYNSPAERAGIKQGGKILKVNDVEVNNTEEFKAAITETFSLLIDYGQEQILYENLKKEEFKETFVKYYDSQVEYGFSGEKIEPNQSLHANNVLSNLSQDTLYLKFTSFNGIANGSVAEWENNLETSAGQFNYAMKHFAQTNKKNLILDLRNNGGGFLSILTSIVSHFISDDKTSTPIISYAENKDGNKMAEYFSQPTKKSKYNFENVIVLVNSGSASASEALVGAMLDYDRENVLKVVVEGNNGVYSSYGKGIMQDTIVAKNNKQALKLTTAKIFWPLSGISIHKIGINKSIRLYSNKIYESKNQTTSVDPLTFAIDLLNN